MEAAIAGSAVAGSAQAAGQWSMGISFESILANIGRAIDRARSDTAYWFRTSLGGWRDWGGGSTSGGMLDWRSHAHAVGDWTHVRVRNASWWLESHGAGRWLNVRSARLWLMVGASAFVLASAAVLRWSLRPADAEPLTAAEIASLERIQGRALTPAVNRAAPGEASKAKRDSPLRNFVESAIGVKR
jgi:hypothetical protein